MLPFYWLEFYLSTGTYRKDLIPEMVSKRSTGAQTRKQMADVYSFSGYE